MSYADKWENTDNRHVQKFIELMNLETWVNKFESPDEYHNKIVELAKKIVNDPTTQFKPLKYAFSYRTATSLQHDFIPILLAEAGLNHHWDEEDVDKIYELTRIHIWAATRYHPLPRSIAITYFKFLIDEHVEGNLSIKHCSEVNTFNDLKVSDKTEILEHAKTRGLTDLVEEAFTKIKLSNEDDIQSKVVSAVKKNNVKPHLKRRAPKR
tara:strand:- start:447 stop:1076 length:630 start_codon:yes stop_codon:yes gene_type:complete